MISLQRILGCIVVFLYYTAALEDSFAQSSPASQPIASPTAPHQGNALAGEALVANRQQGLCLLCHQAPIKSEQLQGNVGPDLAGVANRLNQEQMRQRIMDSRVINPDSVMPAYFRSTNLNRVSVATQGKSIFSAQQVDDVVAYLLTLK